MAGFGEVARLAEELAGEAGRLKKRAAIVASVARVAETSVEDAGRLCLYLAGQPFAEADARKLSAGGALLSKAVKEISGASDAALTAAYRRRGDMGAAAADVWPAGDGEGLTLAEVDDAFVGMATARTTAARAALVEGLLRRSSALEAKYLLKLMLNDMRIGVKQSLIEEAIAAAAGADVVAVRHAVMLEADLARVVRMAFTGTLAEEAVSSAGVHAGKSSRDSGGGGGAVYGEGRGRGGRSRLSGGQVRRDAGAGALWRCGATGARGVVLADEGGDYGGVSGDCGGVSRGYGAVDGGW